MEPLAETFLLNASRAQLVCDVLRPSLEAGATVLCDRYTDATIAYQGYGRGLDIQMLTIMCDAATNGLIPDRTLLLDLPLDEALRRLKARAGDTPDRIEAEGVDFHARVREGYLELAKVAESRFIVLDATLGPDALAAQAWDLLVPTA